MELKHDGKGCIPAFGSTDEPQLDWRRSDSSAQNSLTAARQRRSDRKQEGRITKRFLRPPTHRQHRNSVRTTEKPKSRARRLNSRELTVRAAPRSGLVIARAVEGQTKEEVSQDEAARS